MTAAILAQILELGAFLAALFYYRKNKSKPTSYLVFFLGLTVCVEILGWYPWLIDLGYLSFLRDSLFQKNYWLFNLYGIISYLFYMNYFKWYLSSKRSIGILNRLSILFLVIGVFENVLSGAFFIKFMPITNIFGTLFVFLSIAFYYLELLKSDQILQVQKTLPFYISVGALLFHLCATPFFIYSSYYSNSIDPAFVSLYRRVIFGINYVLYAIYIAGFLICYRKENPYYPKKSF